QYLPMLRLRLVAMVVHRDEEPDVAFDRIAQHADHSAKMYLAAGREQPIVEFTIARGPVGEPALRPLLRAIHPVQDLGQLPDVGIRPPPSRDLARTLFEHHPDLEDLFDFVSVKRCDDIAALGAQDHQSLAFETSKGFADGNPA